MDLTKYDVIRGPVVTDKAFRQNKGKKLVLEVHPAATKSDIKRAVESVFDVKVAKVCTLNRPGKRRKVQGRVVVGVKKKRAIITLAPGHSLDLFDQAGSAVVKADHGKSSENVG